MKAIVIDIDDTLNNFSVCLQNTLFEYQNSYGLTYEEFCDYLPIVKDGGFPESKFLTTKFSDFRRRIHEQCYQLAEARPDGVEFVTWLMVNGWKVIIATKRDLRLNGQDTRNWLAANDICYDCLFMITNKIVLCHLWDIRYLVDDDIFSILHGKQYGIDVFYPLLDKHRQLAARSAKAFTSFEELKQWIKK
jgi:hypothetical protein